MAHMTEKEWRRFACSKSLDPITGHKLPPEPEIRSWTRWDMDERDGKHKRPPPPKKTWGDIFFDRVGVALPMWLIGIFYITMLCTAAYFIGTLF
jgi:hypothetical protein